MANVMKAALIAVCAISGKAVNADEVEHDLLILRFGYYPEKVYVSPGDTIRFSNQSPNWARLESRDPYDNYSNYNSSNPCANTNSFNGSQDGWTTAWIPRYGSTIKHVTTCMEDEIEAPIVWQYSTYDSYNEGWVSFDHAPTGG